MQRQQQLRLIGAVVLVVLTTRSQIVRTTPDRQTDRREGDKCESDGKKKRIILFFPMDRIS